MFVLGQEYYNEEYYQDPDPGLAEAEEPGHSAMFDDEAVRYVLILSQLIKRVNMVCPMLLIRIQRPSFLLFHFSSCGCRGKETGAKRR